MIRDQIEVLVESFFKDTEKTKLWFASPNPLLGGMTPNQMLDLGRGDKLLDFVKGQLVENPPSRPEWDDYFLDIARTVARRSTCLRVPSGVGAVLVRDRRILSTGYAGSIRGQPHCLDSGCLIDEKTGGCVRTVHSEQNAILQAAEHGVGIAGATLYSTMSPCWVCFKLLANGGVTRVVYAVEYREVERQRGVAAACGIPWVHRGTEVYRG